MARARAAGGSRGKGSDGLRGGCWPRFPPPPKLREGQGRKGWTRSHCPPLLLQIQTLQVKEAESQGGKDPPRCQLATPRCWGDPEVEQAPGCVFLGGGWQRRGPAAARATPEVRPGCRRHTEVAAKNCCARGLDKC